jgi:hypothetical protein
MWKRAKVAPFEKRGLRGDFCGDMKPSVTAKISPGPSFPKRGKNALSRGRGGRKRSTALLISERDMR